MLPGGCRIRPAKAEDAEHLPAIERDAAELFRTVGLWGPAYESVRSREDHADAARAGIAWVAECDGLLCGFALGTLVDGHLHLLELAVRRNRQGHGLGRALLAEVIGHARSRLDPALTLTTHRDISWNGPFYRRHGFVEVDAGELTPGLARIVAEETEEGLDPALRCVMAKIL
jgi:GNAT superfamily N-acetyltransferase